MEYAEILNRLQQLSEPDKVAFKEKKYGIIANNSLGIYQKDIKELAKEIGKNSELAIQLFDSGIYEARILCSKLFKPKELTEVLMEKWVKTFENWEICDSFSMGLFAKSEYAVSKAIEWSARSNEFEKRAGFAIMAAYCMADKKAENGVYEALLPIVLRESTDERNFVKKAVNWALRSIGKRNKDLNKSALQTAYKIAELDNKAAKWIAKDAIRELSGDKVNILDYPRSIYRAIIN